MDLKCPYCSSSVFSGHPDDYPDDFRWIACGNTDHCSAEWDSYGRLVEPSRMLSTSSSRFVEGAGIPISERRD